MTVLATIVVLGVLIFVHELGHFAAAKAVGIEVQRFSIGLGPKVVGFQKGETEYVLSWIPLGGYVKMGGMDDEVMERIEGGSEGTVREPSARDFDAKPIWARTIVISAGVVMNMLFAFVTYVSVNAIWGVQELDETRIGMVAAETLPEGTESLAALEVGSRFTRIGNYLSIRHWGDVRDAVLDAEPGVLAVETADPAGTFEVEITGDLEQKRRILSSVGWWVPATLGDVNPGSPAQKAGLEEGDAVIAIEDSPIRTWHDFVIAIQARPEVPTELVLERDGRRLVRTVTPDRVTEENAVTGEIEDVGRVGVYAPLVDFAYEPVTIAQAFVLGYDETVRVTGIIMGFLKDLVTGGVSPRSLGSIGTIAVASGEAARAGMDIFLRFMALFSINLAILNLLPIPILDGGHLVFLAIESVRGKALSIEQRIRWSNVGLLVVMGIMLWALSNDILRWLGL